MKVEILGSVQDGGVPHLGCECKVCEEARGDPIDAPNKISSLMLKESGEKNGVRYMIEATPDIRIQMLGEYMDGVFLPHGELGPTGGLLFFGREGIDSDHLNVYCNEGVKHFLMNNDPYRKLVDRGNIDLLEMEDKDVEEIQGGEVTIHTFHHPHFSEDTTGYMISGDKKSVFYLSDVQEFTDEMIELIKEADIAIIDGTFWDEEEIDRMDEVPHPTITESMDRFEDLDTEIHFTHLNHTNPALLKDSEERQEVEDRGFYIAEEEREFEI